MSEVVLYPILITTFCRGKESNNNKSEGKKKKLWMSELGDFDLTKHLKIILSVLI